MMGLNVMWKFNSTYYCTKTNAIPISLPPKIQYSLINWILWRLLPSRSERWEREAQNALLIDSLVTAPVHPHFHVSLSIHICLPYLLLSKHTAPPKPYLWSVFLSLPLFCSLSCIICVLSRPHFISPGDNLSLSFFFSLAPSLTPSLSTAHSE